MRMGHSSLLRSPIIHYCCRQKFGGLQIRILLLSHFIQIFCSPRIIFINILLFFPVLFPFVYVACINLHRGFYSFGSTVELFEPCNCLYVSIDRFTPVYDALRRFTSSLIWQLTQISFDVCKCLFFLFLFSRLLISLP